MSAPQVLDWDELRDEAARVHARLVALPITSPEVPALLERGVVLLRLAREYRLIEMRTLGGPAN